MHRRTSLLYARLVLCSLYRWSKGLFVQSIFILLQFEKDADRRNDLYYDPHSEPCFGGKTLI